MPDLQAQCKAVQEAVKETASFIQEEKENFTRQQVQYKGWNDLVTYVDQEAERQLIPALKAIVPEAEILAEEGHPTANSYRQPLWIIDPLDGTLNFVHKLPMYAISVGLWDPEQGLQLGVVYDPNLDECFHAVQGGGAYLNKERIHVSATEDMASALFATGFPVNTNKPTDHFTTLLNHLLSQTRGVRRFGSAALDLCYTAAGRFDGYYECGLKPWDVAAGALLVQEAGGLVTDFQNGTDFLFGQEVAAGNAAIQSAFLKLYHQHAKKA